MGNNDLVSVQSVPVKKANFKGQTRPARKLQKKTIRQGAVGCGGEESSKPTIGKFGLAAHLHRDDDGKTDQDILNAAKTAHNLEAKHFRFDFCFENIEKGDYGNYDRILGLLNQYNQQNGSNIKVLAILNRCQRDSKIAEPLSSNPAEMDKAASYCYSAASHFKGKIDHYELPNEPNNPLFHPVTDPAKSAEFTIKCSYQVKKVDTNNVVISGGVFGNGIADDYYKTFYQKGANQSVDMISIHPYPASLYPTPNKMIESIREIRAFMDSHGDQDKEIAITEFGFMGCRTPACSESQMGKMLDDYFTAIKDQVRIITYYELKDHGGLDPNSLDGHGLLNSNGTPKKEPYEAYKKHASGN